MKRLNVSRLACVRCSAIFPLEDDRVACHCGGLLDVVHDLQFARAFGGDRWRRLFATRRHQPVSRGDMSGVWRFRDLVLPSLRDEDLVTRGEGNTRLYEFPRTNAWLDCPNVRFKHEGENPTGSFKDRGMTVAMSWAKARGATSVVCASTGNTSASVASYAALGGLPAAILIPEHGTALGKVSQSLAYGARTMKIRGDFDAALRLVMEARADIGYAVMNSVNPVRLEGQKTIIWEMLEQLDWNPPEWVVVPGGNLGNAAAFGKALHEACSIGLIDRMPRLAVVQARGANPFYRSYMNGWKPVTVKADTVATAIKIGAPVNGDKARRSIEWTKGVVTDVTDEEIMEAKAVVDSDGVGAEPAACATAAGIRRLRNEGIIRKKDRVVAILTGHMLKDPDATIGYHAGTLEGIRSTRANESVVIDATIEELKRVLASK